MTITQEALFEVCLTLSAVSHCGKSIHTHSTRNSYIRTCTCPFIACVHTRIQMAILSRNNRAESFFKIIIDMVTKVRIQDPLDSTKFVATYSNKIERGL